MYAIYNVYSPFLYDIVSCFTVSLYQAGTTMEKNNYKKATSSRYRSFKIDYKSLIFEKYIIYIIPYLTHIVPPRGSDSIRRNG
jgi:hypothetical protein